MDGSVVACSNENQWRVAYQFLVDEFIRVTGRDPRPQIEELRRVRHIARGSEYEVLGIGKAQISKFAPSGWPANARMISDYDELVVYRGADGQLWIRFPDEFEDGRFEDIQ